MKLAALTAALKPFLATDADPAKLQAAILAADKKGRDENSGLGPKEIEKEDNKKGTDKAKDAEGEGDNPDGKPKAKDKAKDKDCAAGAVDEDKDEDGKAKDADMDDVDAEDEDNGGLNKADTTTAGGKKYAKPTQDTAKIVADALAARDALHQARADVQSTIGVVAMDSAEDVYKAALVKLGVTVDGIHPSAFKALFAATRKAVDASTPRVITGDAATVQTMETGIKGYDRLK